MYSCEELKKYNYFKDIVTSNNVNDFLDSLTGVLQRKHLYRYIESLINDNIPFTMAILDIDNFKHVNDKYGHAIGDEILEQLSEKLRVFIGLDGLVGRYGGDEFIFVWTKSIDFNDVHDFYSKMNHGENKFLRFTYPCTGCQPFITGTIGSASFPKDAQTFNGMFDLCDKTLYRGKIKGRNCYIIYQEFKHKYITVQELAEPDIFQILTTLTNKFYCSQNIKIKIRNCVIYLRLELKLDNVYYIKQNGDVIDVNDYTILGNVQDLADILNEDHLFTSSTSDNIKAASPSLAKALEPFGIHSILFTDICSQTKKYGYIFYALERASRIWQPADKAGLLYLSKLIASHLDLHPDEV